MRLMTTISLATALLAAACGGNPSAPTKSSSAATLSGTWSGSASDSSGSMMGGATTGSMMGGTTWSITQTGNTFSGTMQVSGQVGGTMTVSGMMSGTRGSFTMTMAGVTMMSGSCSATATGTFDMDDMMTELHATYTGMNTCTGAFDHGQMTMTHR